MKSRIVVNVLAASILAAAGMTGASGPASAASATVSHASSSALSPNLSDLPTAHSAPGQEVKLATPPKPLPPRGAGPGGTNTGDKALQKQAGPPSRVPP